MMMIALLGCGSDSPSTAATTAAGSNATAAAGTQKPAGTDQPSEPVAKDPVTVTLFYPMTANMTPEDFGVIGDQVLEEKTGVHIEWELVPDTSVAERFNITMASGNIPDIMMGSVSYTGNSNLRKYKEAFLPLNDYIIGKRPNLEDALFNDEYVNRYLTEEDGNIYIIPMLATRVVGDIFLMRDDLMIKHNLEEAVTYQDWFDLLVKIKELEPDITPYCTRHKRAGLMRMAEAWGVKEDFFYDYDENVIKYGVTDPRLKEVVQYLHDMYAAGLIDPEYITADTTSWQEQILTNGVFAMNDNITRIDWTRQQFDLVGKTDQAYRGVLPMVGPEGIQMTTIQYPRVRGNSISISAKSKYHEEIIDMYEYIFSEEGTLLVNWGVEGYSYEIVDGKPQFLESYTTGLAEKTLKAYGPGRDSPKLQADELQKGDRGPEILEPAEKYLNVIRKDYLTPLTYTEEELSISTPIIAELNTFKDEWLDKFITGIEPMDKYDAFVEQFKTMGVDTVVKIRNDALDRYLNN